jgi:RNA polymerase sigma-70 factor (sigma-E family)
MQLEEASVPRGGLDAAHVDDHDPSFDDFVRARLPQLLRLGRALTGDEHRAADLVQDALERTLPRWRVVRADNPEGYVRRIMVNRNISTWRRARREWLSDRPSDLLPPQTGHEPSIARDDELWAALRRLAPRQRTVIALRYFADQTEAQTAALMGCSVGAVKSQAHTALSRLRELLAETEEDR